MTSARRPARDRDLAGARDFGGGNGDHLRVEGNETNPDGGAPVVDGGNGGAAELLLLTAHLTVMAATDGDDGDGGATMPKMTGGGGGLGERRDGARRHGRTRERGQTKEEITGKEEETERNKTPQSIGEDGVGFGRIWGGKRRLGFGSAAPGRRLTKGLTANESSIRRSGVGNIGENERLATCASAGHIHVG
uniref:DUF834 domain-containing protein n=1 Tax=Oryza sativa subsp. japonica TaxID=39947 RepID=Q8W2T0_ORYSJ|nr:hypothetical protein [Oryza sativa Japonica Group]